MNAFAQMPTKRLVVVGEGPMRRKLEASATANVTFLGWAPAQTLRALTQRSRAFIFAAEEDFGILPVEAQACGTPIIGYGRGGLRETVCGVDHQQPTGVFFDRHQPAALVHAVAEFETNADRIHAASCIANAQRFSAERFRREIQSHVKAEWSTHRARCKG